MTTVTYFATIQLLEGMENMFKFAFFCGAFVPALMVSIPAYITGVIVVNAIR